MAADAALSPVWACPARRERAELNVKGSRFLAEAGPVEDEFEVAACVARLREEFPRATHHCWGARLRARGEILERAADAGEPAGSAGEPILRALRSAGLEGAAVVVVRWFGGTKLGSGPLARAYRDAATLSLAAAGTARRRLYRELRVRFPWEDSGALRRALARSGGEVLAEQGGAGGEILVRVPIEEAAALVQAIADASRGRAEVEAVRTCSGVIP
jgi:putative IMPACT (imprinted ancient) family translation regulator